MAESSESQRPGTTSVTGGVSHQPFDHPQARPTVGGHPHGRPVSWVLTGFVIAAFLAGGAALIVHLWWLFWVCVGVVVLAVPVGKVIGIMDDTVVFGATPGHNSNELPGHATGHDRSRAEGALPRD